MNEQSQEGGEGSINVQGQTINLGVSYSDARQIALDVFRVNFLELSQEAKVTASARAVELTERFLNLLAQKFPAALSAMKEPDMQYSLYIAQREHARAGDKDLADILVDILVDRALCQSHDLTQIVLNESLVIAPKLTIKQLDALSLIFLIRYTRVPDLGSRERACQYIEECYVPFIENFSNENSCYQHLEYAGCGTVGMVGVSIENAWAQMYPGLFIKGFEIAEFDKIMEGEQCAKHLLMPCLNNTALFQLRAANLEAIQGMLLQCNIPDEKREALKSLQTSHAMNGDEIRQWLSGCHPRMPKLLEVWSNSNPCRMTLTSVGIAIAHANLRRKTGVTLDLSQWIP